MTGTRLSVLALIAALAMVGCGSKADADAEKPVDKSALGSSGGAKGPAVTKPTGTQMDQDQKAAIEFEQGKK